MKKISKILFIVSVVLLGSPLGGAAISDRIDLKRDIQKGDALIWYLGHAAWAVKTENHFLIFRVVLRSH